MVAACGGPSVGGRGKGQGRPEAEFTLWTLSLVYCGRPSSVFSCPDAEQPWPQVRSVWDWSPGVKRIFWGREMSCGGTGEGVRWGRATVVLGRKWGEAELECVERRGLKDEGWRLRENQRMNDVSVAA